jgi:hypothetical protein
MVDQGCSGWNSTRFCFGVTSLSLAFGEISKEKKGRGDVFIMLGENEFNTGR